MNPPRHEPAGPQRLGPASGDRPVLTLGSEVPAVNLKEAKWDGLLAVIERRDIEWTYHKG